MGALHLVRLVVALLVLACAMASPASAAAAMATRAMPCHEPAVSMAVADHGGHADHSSHVASAGQGGALLYPPAPDSVRLHMCCVLSQLVAPPLTAASLVVPAPRTVALSLPDTAPLPGIAWPAPVPPPKTV